MITVGLVKELHFLAHVFHDTYTVDLKREQSPHVLKIKINAAGDLDVFYGENHIWYEKVEGDSSFFGIESCDTISRIMACIDNGTTWDHLKWQDSLDKIPSLS